MRTEKEIRLKLDLLEEGMKDDDITYTDMMKMKLGAGLLRWVLGELD